MQDLRARRESVARALYRYSSVLLDMFFSFKLSVAHCRFLHAHAPSDWGELFGGRHVYTRRCHGSRWNVHSRSFPPAGENGHISHTHTSIRSHLHLHLLPT
jgi:hypothetical protein